MTPGPVPVPELVRVDPTADGVGGWQPVPQPSTPVGDLSPGWWVAFDAQRFPQPPQATSLGAHPPPSGPPRLVPELPRTSAMPWPPPVHATAAPVGTTWWLAADGRWYPSVPAPGPHVGPATAHAHRSLPKGRRVVAGVCAACAIVGIGFVVGTALGPTSGTVRPRSAPAGSGPASRPAAVPATTRPDPPATAAPPAAVPTTLPATAATIPASTTVTAPPAQAPSGDVYQYETGAAATSVAQLAADPAGGAGRRVVFTGVIAAFAVDGSGGAVAMYVRDPSSPSTVVLVQLSQYDEVTRIDTGDTVVVWGDATGRVTYANSVGQPTDVTNVDEMYLTDRTSGYQDTGASSPS